MISFAEHSKNADHFNRIGQKIVTAFDKYGLFKTFLWSGWARPNLGWSLSEIALNDDGTVTLSAGYYPSGGNREEGDIKIPASLMDVTECEEAWQTTLDSYLMNCLEEKDESLHDAAAKRNAEQLAHDEAELARLQAKVSAARAAAS